MNKEHVPKVTVLLPVRDGAPFIAGAVGSLLDQTFADIEVLVLDDGSRDRTTEVVASIADSRIRIISDGRRCGLAARLNQGIDLARGGYIARMDADDLCFPHRLELQVAFLDSHLDIDLVSGRAIVFRDEGLTPVGMLPYRQFHEAIIAHPWRGIPMPHPSWMGRVEWFRLHRYRFPEVMRAEDQELLLRALPKSRYHSLPDVLLAYRQGDFSFPKTWLARRSLLAAQLKLFAERLEAWNAVRAVLSTGIKVVFDVIAAIPGCERIFFARMGQALPEGVDREFHRLVSRYMSGQYVKHKPLADS